MNSSEESINLIKWCFGGGGEGGQHVVAKLLTRLLRIKLIDR